MYSQTKKHSKFCFIFLFILNFKSLNTESNEYLNNQPIEINSSSCLNCLNETQNSSFVHKSVNSSKISSQNRSIIDSANNNQRTLLNSPVKQLTYNSYDASFQFYRSTPNIVLLADFTSSNKLRTNKQNNSRKKQLDLEFDPINIRSNLNYNLDETTDRKKDEKETINEKDKPKLKIDSRRDNFKNSTEIRNNEKDTQINLNLDQPTKQVNRQTNTQINSESKTDKQIIDKQLKQEINQLISSTESNQYKQINERMRNRRLNEQINRRIKNPRQIVSTQSNLSILRRFYPINQINQLANINKYSVEDAKLATLEIAKLQKEGKCKLPSKRVIPINKLLKNHHLKKILPHCTILHRCESDTGCCNSESEHCTVKKQEPVRLPFWVISLNADGEQFKNIEWFTFHNHTECECKLKTV